MEGDMLVDVDGRTVAAHVAGEGTSGVVVYHHGSTGGRLSVRLLHEGAARAGVLVVGVDRPGYGLSDPYPYTLESVAADTAAVAAEVGADRAWVVGQSSGAAYALATAALRPDLVRAVALGGSAVPYRAGTAAWDALSEDERRGLSLVGTDDASAERLLAAEDASYAEEVRTANEQQLLVAVLGADGAERDDEAAALARIRVAALKDGLRQGMAGWGRDNVVRMARWDVPLEQVRCPVTAWFGEHERDADERIAWLSEHVPGLRPRVVAGAGHAVLSERWSEVLAVLLVSGA